MKLRIFKSIENLVYVVRFENDIIAMSNSDKSLMQRFGEPEINMGGTIPYSATTYVLDNKFARIRSDFPQRVELDSRSVPFNTSTLTKVNAYVAEITARFSAAVAALRANTDGFTSEIIENI